MSSQKDSSEKSRIAFLREDWDPSKGYLGGTLFFPVFQGFFVYVTKDGIYTQSSDKTPKKIIIRGNQIEYDLFLPRITELFEALRPLDEDTCLVFIISRQDLLITDKKVDGTQVIFLGFLDSKNFLLPTIVAKAGNSKVEKILESMNIQSRLDYQVEQGDVFYPGNISTPEQMGTRRSFVHWNPESGTPVTVMEPNYKIIADLYSDTQNNKQLFCKCAFVWKKPKSVEETEKILSSLEPFTPEDKIVEFKQYLENFKLLLSFFSRQSVCFGILKDQWPYLEFNAEEKAFIDAYKGVDDEDPNFFKVKMLFGQYNKTQTALKKLLESVKKSLDSNFEKGPKISLSSQIKKAIFEWFCFSKEEGKISNTNSGSHLIKWFSNGNKLNF